jgi:hypothetical protein
VLYGSLIVLLSLIIVLNPLVIIPFIPLDPCDRVPFIPIIPLDPCDLRLRIIAQPRKNVKPPAQKT